MKKFIFALSCSIIIFVSIIFILNIEVTTQQGVNYKWHSVKLPLYLKMLDFFDRHYNYKLLVKRITVDTKTKEERVLKIFEWTYRNIIKSPKGFLVIDDHVWYIIVRGYGENDQLSDVFTVLCNYAGVDAFYGVLQSKDGRSPGVVISYVKLGEKWRLFDPYNGSYFVNSNGDFASIEEINIGNWQAKKLSELESATFNYGACFINLPTIKDAGLRRANVQSPLRRLILEARRRMGLM